MAIFFSRIVSGKNPESDSSMKHMNFHELLFHAHS